MTNINNLNTSFITTTIWILTNSVSFLLYPLPIFVSWHSTPSVFGKSIIIYSCRSAPHPITYLFGSDTSRWKTIKSGQQHRIYESYSFLHLLHSISLQTSRSKGSQHLFPPSPLSNLIVFPSTYPVSWGGTWLVVEIFTIWRRLRLENKSCWRGLFWGKIFLSKKCLS